MNIKKIIEEMFGEIVEDYENEKMIENRGIRKEIKAKDFLKDRR